MRIFLECVSDKSREEVIEWRNINWELDDENNKEFTSGLIQLFDWDLNFFDHLPKN